MNNLKKNEKKYIPPPIKIPDINFENISTPLVEKKAINDINRFIDNIEKMNNIDENGRKLGNY